MLNFTPDNAKEIKGSDINVTIGKWDYYFTFWVNNDDKKIFLVAEAEDENGNGALKITRAHKGPMLKASFWCFAELKIGSKNEQFRSTMDKFIQQVRQLAIEEGEEW